MPSAPPSFGSQEYWNDRFTSNSNPFEWLEAPTVLDPYIVDALQQTTDSNPQLLQIGCGTSLLSFHLRAHVKSPEQIHNLDYSDVAIGIGKKREVDIFIKEQSAPTSYMKWSSANLLDYHSLLEACQPSKYSVIVDKSTSDSIACSDDLYVPLPYHVVTAPERSRTVLTHSSEPIHPLHVMAIHLALVAKPKTRWISLSYSMDRFPFLQSPSSHSVAEMSTSTKGITSANDSSQEGSPEITTGSNNSEKEMSLDDDLDDIPQEVVDIGLPDPGTLWRLIGKYEIEPPPSPGPSHHSGTTHRPKILHWIYVLERTDVPLFTR